MVFGDGKCTTCKSQNICKYKEERKKIQDEVDSIGISYGSPISKKVECKEYNINQNVGIR